MTIDPRAENFDPTALLAELTDATGHFVRSVEALDEAEARDASLLPGWTRGHVVTHAARNADALRNLLTWAATGEPQTMYPSLDKRDADIEAGAGRSTAELAADLRDASQRFLDEAARLSPEHWAAKIKRRIGPEYPAHYVLWWRYEEVLIHHVDLDTGFSPAHWPAEFTGPELDLVAWRFGNPELTPQGEQFRLLVENPDLDGEDRIVGVRCAPDDESHPIVRGPEPALVGWLIGRSKGDGLGVEPSGPLPTPPRWM